MSVNNREALVYFRKMLRRHEAGDATGTRALAFCYLSGHGVDQSVERAAAILKTLKEDHYRSQDYIPLRPDKVLENLTFADAIRSNFRMMDTLPLPFSGGWGYSEGRAILLDLSLDEGYEEGRPFNLHLLERLIIENRIFLECVMRATERLSAIEWRVLDRVVIEKDGKVMVKLTIKVHGCPEWVWHSLQQDWRMTRQRTPRSKAESHAFIREWFLRTYTNECWLDITKIPEEFRQLPSKEELKHATKRKKRC